jgi:hypothetical protein
MCPRTQGIEPEIFGLPLVKGFIPTDLLYEVKSIQASEKCRKSIIKFSEKSLM